MRAAAGATILAGAPIHSAPNKLILDGLLDAFRGVAVEDELQLPRDFFGLLLPVLQAVVEEAESGWNAAWAG